MRKRTLMRSGKYAIAFALVCIMAAMPLMSTLLQNGSSASYAYSANVKDITGTVDKVSDKFMANQDIPVFAPDDIVDVIIQLEEDSLADTYIDDYSNVYDSLADYVRAEAGVNRFSALSNIQSTAKAQLSKSFDMEFLVNHSTLLNGFTVRMKYGDINNLKKNKYVKAARVSEYYYKPTAEVVENPVAIHDSGIYDSGNLNYDGTGTVVAVLDTGLDYYHEAFTVMPKNPAMSKSDVQDVIESSAAWLYSYYHSDYTLFINADDVYVNEKVPYAFNYADLFGNADTQAAQEVQPLEDHGTHVAGIIAGNPESKEITGVAPEAQLVIMQVFDAVTGMADETGILMAVSDSVLLGVDVINMSLGAAAGFSSEDDIWNQIYDSVTEVGVSLIVAAGNDANSASNSAYGSTGLLSNPDTGALGAPASYNSAVSVASISGVKSQYLIANGSQPLYITQSTNGVFNDNKPNDFAVSILGNKTSETYEYVKLAGVGKISDYSGLNVTRKIALVPRGDLTFEDKARNAQSRGAAGIIIINNVSGVSTPYLATFTNYPACSITMDIGKQLPQTGTIHVSKDYVAGPFMSDYSSWGVLPNLELKPDLTAHGGEVYSAIPGTDKDGNWNYGRQSGTSMAAPNLAGAVTLLRQHVKATYPNLNAIEVTTLTNQLMMSTASIVRNEEGNAYSPRYQGAGLANVYYAVETDVYLTVDDTDRVKLSIGDDVKKTGKYNLTFNVVNLSNTARSFLVKTHTMTETVSSDNKTVAGKPYMLTNNSVNLSSSSAGLKVNSNKSISIAGGGSGQVTVSVTLSADEKAYLDRNFVNGMFVEGFVQLIPQYENGTELSIPWVGFYGDWSAAPIFDVTVFDVAESAKDQSVNQEDKLKAVMTETKVVGLYASGSNASMILLGEYPFILEDESKKPAPNADKIAISSMSQGVGVYAIYSIFMGSLRNAKEANVKVSNSITGNTVFDETYNNIRKSYSNGAIAVPTSLAAYIDPVALGLPNNSKYNVNVSAKLDWDGEQNNVKDSFGFDFYVDSDAPMLLNELTTLRVEERNNKTRYYLDLFMYDNHYVETMILGAFDENTKTIDKLTDSLINPLDTKRNETSKITVEITDYWDKLVKNDENVYVELMDCAKNTAQFLITLPRIQAETIAFSESEINVRTNETIDLKNYLSVVPDDAWKFNLDWKVSSDAVRIHDGEIMGVTATNKPVTVTVTANELFKATIKVNVIRDDTLTAPVITGFKLGEHSLTVARGSTGTLNATPIPWNADLNGLNIVWETRSEFIELSAPYNNKLSLDYRITDAQDTVDTTGFIRIMVANRASVYADCNFTITKEFKLEGATITEYKGKGGDYLNEETGKIEENVVVIPKGLGVTAIGEAAFANNVDIKKVIIEESISDIQPTAFFYCKRLTEVVLPNTVKMIQYRAFEECENLVKINLGKVETIGFEAFAALNIPELDLSSAQYIGPQAFSSNFAVKQIDLSNCRYMGMAAFAYCEKLESITTGDRTMIGDQSFAACPSLRSLVLNSKNIGYQAFSGCSNLVSVTFNNDIYKLDGAAFSGCSNLKNVVFRGSLANLPADTFGNCISLESVRLPEGLQTIGDTAFYGCSKLQKITFPATAQLQSAGYASFLGVASDFYFEIEEGNPYIQGGDDTAGNKQYKTIYNTGGTKLIAAARLDSYTATNELRIIGSYAFAGNTSFTKVVLTGKTDIIVEDGAFQNTGLANITITDTTVNKGISYIGAGAFANCRSLISFPRQSGTALEYIGDGAFLSCTKFTGFEGSLGNLYYLGHEAFRACGSLVNINLQNAGIDAINIYTFYGTGLTTITIPDSVKTINQYAFGLCDKLVSVDFPKSLETIGGYAFMSCSSLSSINIPESLKLIDGAAFYACTMLSSVDTVYYDEAGNKTTKSGFTEVLEFGGGSFFRTALTEFSADKAVTIGTRVFAIGNTLNSKLTTVNLPRAVTLKDEAFYGCTALTTVSIPRVQVLGSGAFLGCSSLRSVSLPSATEIGANAFYNATNLAYVSAPKAETIGAMAFTGTSLSTLKIDSVRSIGEYAFALTPLSRLSLPASLEHIDEGAFALMPQMSRFEVDPANTHFFTNDGVLYSKTPNNGYQLEAYPIVKLDKTYEILEGTIRIASEAFAYNVYLQEVTMPWSLKTVGDAAFYSCKNLLIYRFNSYEAPILETYYQQGYWYVYINFGELMGNGNVIIERPENGLGYESFIYSNYFNTQYIGTKVADYITMAAIQAINAIPDVINAESKSIIEAARNAYESVTEQQKELVSNYDKLLAAEGKLNNLTDSASANTDWLAGTLIAIGLVLLVIVIAILGRVKSKKKQA